MLYSDIIGEGSFLNELERMHLEMETRNRVATDH